MQDTLITITIVTFGLILLANVFFRIKTFMTFKKLAHKGIGFTKEHVFDRNRLEKEVLARYPEDRVLILAHVNSIKLSMRVSVLGVLVLTLCGAVLMYYRNPS
jgi:hypothetical protein